MEQKMGVLLRICENEWFYHDAVDLPSHWEAIKDVYQRARVADVHSYELRYFKGWPDFLVPILQHAKGTRRKPICWHSGCHNCQRRNCGLMKRRLSCYRTGQ